MSNAFALLWLLVVGAIAFGCTMAGHHGKKPGLERFSILLWILACAPAFLIILPAVAHTLFVTKR